MTTTHHATPPLPLFRVVVSRRDRDCAICALAMLLGLPYEDVLVAVGKVDPKGAGKAGLWATQMRKVAKVLGFTLRTKRVFDLETSAGILNITHLDASAHALFVKDGMAFDYDGCVWDVGDWIGAHQAKVGCLLTI